MKIIYDFNYKKKSQKQDKETYNIFKNKNIMFYKNLYKYSNKKSQKIKFIVTYLNDKYTTVNLDRISIFSINNYKINKNLLKREYFNHGTINYLENYYEFIAFDEIGIFCGLELIFNEFNIRNEEPNNLFNMEYDSSNYTFLESNNILLDLNNLKNNYFDNTIFLNFCENFFNEKKFIIHIDKKIEKEYIYFFYDMNPFKLNLDRLPFKRNDQLIFKINTFEIKNKQDNQFYNFFNLKN